LFSQEKYPPQHPPQGGACGGSFSSDINDVADISEKNGPGAEKTYTPLSRATRKQLADLARAHADELRQGGADVDLRAVEAFIRERVEAAVEDPEQIEPEVATITEMLFQ
jgi:hypothetical protein